MHHKVDYHSNDHEEKDISRPTKDCANVVCLVNGLQTAADNEENDENDECGAEELDYEMNSAQSPVLVREPTVGSLVISLDFGNVQCS